MAIAVAHPLLSFFSPAHHRRLCRNSYSATSQSFVPSSSPRRFHAIPKSSPEENSISTDNRSKGEAEYKHNSDPFLSSSNWLVKTLRLLDRLRNELKVDELGLEILSISLPAVLALAADPLALLVDSAFVGHLGSKELAAVGVSISVFNLVSKLFNVPLLNITTSFVAEEQALAGDTTSNALQTASAIEGFSSDRNRKLFLPSVSASLVLAAAVGIAETVLISTGSGFLMNIMGIPFDSAMRSPAEKFLTLRAFGAPPTVIALAAQGTFRGFMDTRTPLFAVVVGNLLNAVLDPVLIFLFGWGIEGAAFATVSAEYIIAFILVWNLSSKVVLIPPNIDVLGIARYLKSGGLLIGRTIAVLVTMTLATSMAAQQGTVPMAGHQICLQVWLTVSLLTDALALAGQALLARMYIQGNYQQARRVIYKVLLIGALTGISLATFLFIGFGTFLRLFSTDPNVLEIASSGILFVAGSQPVNGIAFVFDGLYYGAGDFAYAACSMALAGLISSVFILMAAPMFGLGGVWAGLFLFMTLRVVAGCWRLGSKDGPWDDIWSEVEAGVVKK